MKNILKFGKETFQNLHDWVILLLKLSCLDALLIFKLSQKKYGKYVGAFPDNSIRTE